MRTLLNKPVHCRNSAMLTGLCLCLIHMYAQVNATNSNSYIERYKAILLQHPEFTPFSWGSNTIYIDTEYTLYDVDKNGIPELIVKEDRSKYYIYSFNGTDVISSDVCYWSFDDDFVVEMIQNLEDAKNVDTINGETLFSIPSASLSFRGEGATVKLAEDDGNLLKVFVANKQTAGFNPFD